MGLEPCQNQDIFHHKDSRGYNGDGSKNGGGLACSFFCLDALTLFSRAKEKDLPRYVNNTLTEI